MYSLLAPASAVAKGARSRGRCGQCACRKHGICAPLDGPDRDLMPEGAIRRLRRGETLVWADEPDQDIANIVSGAFKLFAASPDGRQRTVGVLLPGDFVGDPAGGPLSVGAVALGEATACILPRRAVARAVAQSPEFAATFVQRAVGDLDRARRWMALLGGRSATGRVASLLSILAGTGVQPGTRIAIPFSRGDMADLLGLSLETVSRRLHALSDSGVIALPDLRGFVVRDADRLAAEAA